MITVQQLRALCSEPMLLHTVRFEIFYTFFKKGNFDKKNFFPQIFKYMNTILVRAKWGKIEHSASNNVLYAI